MFEDPAIPVLVPRMSIMGVNQGEYWVAMGPRGGTWDQRPNADSVNFKMTQQRGQHYLKWGADTRGTRTTSLIISNNPGFGFQADPTSATYVNPDLRASGDGYATFLLGAVQPAGGGADGTPLMQAYVGAIRLLGPRADFDTLMAVGANADPHMLNCLEKEAEGLPIHVVSFTEDSASHITAADLVVCMAGYNTISEVLYRKKKALVIPRSGPSAEQRLRAKLLAQRGLIDMLDPDDLCPETLAERLLEDLDRTDFPVEEETLPMEGARRAADHLLALAA